MALHQSPHQPRLLQRLNQPLHQQSPLQRTRSLTQPLCRHQPLNPQSSSWPLPYHRHRYPHHHQRHGAHQSRRRIFHSNSGCATIVQRLITLIPLWRLAADCFSTIPILFLAAHHAIINDWPTHNHSHLPSTAI
ncbi:hypothetical protein PV10_06461 [Exophiala mesophila]|uniref:Uncharacterized protein n=1 Tax=Exophiala mesophila TaxID=212818 RepID=A0A0D1XUT2_EXOME|nr:uncharacterized protein PV10_06461 [Exophiala mesophila]KIV91976.1 hypothetical protein PV10_06461 [Exophiala mesophila]